MPSLGASRTRWMSLLFIVPLLITPAKPRQRKVTANAKTGVNVVTVDASMQQFLSGALVWLAHHPEAVSQARSQPLIPAPDKGTLKGSNQDASSPAPLKLKMPSIDLYTPSGVSIYHGEDPRQNAVFVASLPRIPANSANKTKFRPTLKEALGMLPELQPYETAILASKHDTVLAITYPADSTRCGAQDRAVQQLKERARRIGINVVEVRLHSEKKAEN